MYFRNYLYLFYATDKYLKIFIALYVTSQEIANVFELMTQIMDFAPYMEVNIIIYNICISNFSATKY